jgi:DNA invertase Pin-like site-specific DNA recombinase
MRRFAFYGRVSTEDRQDPASSRAWQQKRAVDLIEPHGGQIVVEYFDIGQSRSLPWQRRPEASRLLQALSDHQRGFDGVVIGEPQRAFSGSQFSLTFPLFVHHGVSLWVPEVGGAVDPDSEAHDLVMTLFGGMSKGERNRIRTRVRAAMRVQAQDGRYLGGRPPYGYQLADIGAHPNPEKARIGQRLHRLEPEPATAAVVRRIFTEFVAGSGYSKIASALTEDGILSPSGHDPDRNRHRSGSAGVWGKSAVKAILQNPRYTGYSVWARQRRDEVLLDETNVAFGHQSKLRWNDEDAWIWSDEPTHEPIIDRKLFDEAQRNITAGSRPQHGNRKTPNPYLLKGMVRCSICGRKMQGNQLRGSLHYRCVMKQEYPGADHPRSLSVQEAHLLPAVDEWLSQLFTEDRIEETCRALQESQETTGASADELEAQRVIKECDAELANYRAALRTAPSETVAHWIAETEDRRKAAELRLRRLTTGQGMTAAEIREVVERMRGIVAILESATPDDRRRIYEAAQLSIEYDHDNRRAKLRTAPYPGVWSSERVGGASCTPTPHTESGWIPLPAAA